MENENDPARGPEPPKLTSPDVGYRRPPPHTRFKPGQSGNPKGRKRGGRNAKSEIAAILGERVRVREGEKVRTTTKFGAMALAHVQNGMKGDVRSFNAVTSMMARTGLLDSTEHATEILSAEDEAIILDYVARVQSDAGIVIAKDDEQA